MSRPYPPCPSWCTIRHDLAEVELGELQVMCRAHEGTVDVVTVAGRKLATVGLSRYDDLMDDITGEPGVWVASDDALTPAFARRLAALLLDAADRAEAPNSRCLPR